MKSEKRNNINKFSYICNWINYIICDNCKLNYLF